MLLIPGLERSEWFKFPDNWKIITDYIFSESGVIDSNCSLGNRAVGNLRRSKLFKDNILISESIENNPNHLPSSEIKRLNDKGEFIGEEFERTINFANGYVAKIEYSHSENKQQINQGIYFSKYRHMILLNEKNHVVSEIFEENPNFGKKPYNKESANYFRFKGVLI